MPLDLDQLADRMADRLADRLVAQLTRLLSAEPDGSPSESGDLHLTSDDLAGRYQVPAATVRYWRHLGTGPKAIKVGRAVRYRLEDVIAWEQTLQESAR